MRPSQEGSGLKKKQSQSAPGHWVNRVANAPRICSSTPWGYLHTPLLIIPLTPSFGTSDSLCDNLTSLTCCTFGLGDFSSLLTSKQAVRPRRRPLAWVMRQVEEIYDSRYARDSAGLQEGNPDDRLSSIFPVFVYDFFSKRYWHSIATSLVTCCSLSTLFSFDLLTSLSLINHNFLCSFWFWVVDMDYLSWLIKTVGICCTTFTCFAKTT